eukprot:GHVO01041440.1.p1 GENE.GHVO01041440.1~~GHVO01041440.1.p1  ORF type:complete len:204 (+),score=4.42 GHVO01041440.1:214-825(+)
MFSVFFRLTLISRSLIAFLHSPVFVSTSSLSLQHNTISSANIMLHGRAFFTLSEITSMTISNKYGLSTDPWCSPTFTGNLSVSPTLLQARFFTPSYMSCTSPMFFSGTPFALMYHHSSWRGTLSYAFSKSMNTMCNPFCFSLCISMVNLSIDIASVVLRPGMKPNCSSPMVVSSLNLWSMIFPQTFKAIDYNKLSVPKKITKL